MRTLLIVTQSYPFGDHTDFLEDEIWELVKQFDEIVVAPISPLGVRQRVPEKVTVDMTLSHQQTRLHRALSAATPLGARLLAAEVARRPSGLWSPSSFLRALLASGAASSVSRWCRHRPRHETVDVVYTYWLSPLAIGLRRAWPGVTLVSRVHRGDLFVEFSHRSYLPLHEQSIDACDVVASVSEHGATYLRMRYPRVSDRITVERLGTMRAPAASRSVDAIVRIVSCSSLTEVKQPELLVRTISELARHWQVRWDHFGDGPLRSLVEDHLREHPEHQLDAVLHGQVPNTVVFEHYREHPVDVFVNCSSSEGVPVSIMEAISAGIPVVATNVGGTPEIVQPVCGRLVDPSTSPAVVADAIQQLLADPGSNQARIEFWSQNYDATTNYRRFAMWLRRLGEGGHE